MPEIGRWKGYVFEVSPTVIRGFTGLTVRGSSELEEKTTSGQKYVSRKAGKPTETTFTIKLSAYTGCNVRDDALKFVQDAKAGTKDYFYIGGKKLVPSQLMLTDAEASEIEIGPRGQWVSCKVDVTMKQCTKDDGSTASSSSTSKKASVKKTPYAGKGTGASSNGTSSTSIPASSLSLFKPYVATQSASITLFQKAVAAVKKTVSAAKAASKTSGALAKVKLLKLIK